MCNVSSGDTLLPFIIALQGQWANNISIYWNLVNIWLQLYVACKGNIT